MSSTAKSEDKIEQLQQLELQHGQDYGLGVDDIVKQFNKKADRQVRRDRNKQSGSKKDSKKVTDVDKFLGVLSVGKLDVEGIEEDVENPEQIRAQAARKFGADYATKFPEIEEAIQSQFPSDQFGFALGEIRDFGRNERFRYIGNNQWEKVK